MGDVIATAVGLAVLIVVGIPVISAVVVAGITVLALQIAIVVAVGGYILGIPYSIWFRLSKGAGRRADPLGSIYPALRPPLHPRLSSQLVIRWAAGPA